MTTDARLQFNSLQQSLEDWTKGMTPGNPMSYTLGVTNYITKSDIPIDWKAALYFWQYTDSAAKSSTFIYKLQPSEADIHDGLERGSMSDIWQDTPDPWEDKVWYGDFEARTDGFTIEMPDPGINRAPGSLFQRRQRGAGAGVLGAATAAILVPGADLLCAHRARHDQQRLEHQPDSGCVPRHAGRVLRPDGSETRRLQLLLGAGCNAVFPSLPRFGWRRS